MLLPVAFAALRIFVPGGDFTGETENQYVVPAVLVEIVGECEKVVRVGIVGAKGPFETLEGFFRAIGFLQFERLRGRIVFVALPKVRPLPPIGTGNDVQLAVVIEVAEVGAFAPEFVGELDLLERGQSVIFGPGEW
jgi:hypothetical protein